MHEWLSGGVSPCQGEGRGFESRLVLFLLPEIACIYRISGFICVLNALSILFADELFRWNLVFRISNADHAEPSDWEIAGRYISWTCMSIMALVLFIIGLQ